MYVLGECKQPTLDLPPLLIQDNPLGTKIAHLGVVVLIIITLHTKATNQDTLSSEVIVKQVGVVRSPHAAVGAVSPKAQAVS